MKIGFVFLFILSFVFILVAPTAPAHASQTNCSLDASIDENKNIVVKLFTSDTPDAVKEDYRLWFSPQNHPEIHFFITVEPTKTDSSYTYTIDPSTLTVFEDGSGYTFDSATASVYAVDDGYYDDTFGDCTPSSGVDNPFGGEPVVDDPATSTDPCARVPTGRKQECSADPYAYNDDPCFSPNSVAYVKDAQGNSVYDSTDCKAKRGKKKCEAKTSTDGSVYLKAFGLDPEKSCVTFLGFTQSIIKYVMLAASIIVGFMLLVGGFKYLTSRGNAAGLMDARDQILHATIGLVLLATAYLIVLLLQGSFGYLQLNLIGPFGAVFGK